VEAQRLKDALRHVGVGQPGGAGIAGGAVERRTEQPDLHEFVEVAGLE
jgi:hypothetical protein